jgi:oligopeptide transport system permease protein
MPIDATSDAKVRSPLGDAWFDLRHRKVFWFSSVIIFFIMMITLFPNAFADVNKTSSLTGGCDFTNAYLLPPSSTYWFGTDKLGCDIYSLTIFGARPSVAVGFTAIVLTTLLGSAVGLIAGFYGGATDAVLSRIVDIFFGLPLLLGGIVILTAINFPSIWGVVFVLVVLGWVGTTRLVRSTTIEAKGQDYVMAARALGADNRRIMWRHILPNAVGPAVVVSVIGLGVYIGAEATFSYLGLGLQDPDFSWGTMISDAQVSFFVAPWTLLFPAGFLTITILAFILLGDAVSDALDPKRRR